MNQEPFSATSAPPLPRALALALTFAALLAATPPSGAAEAVVAHFDLVPEDAMRLLGGYAPQRLSLAPTPPPSVKTPPSGLKAADARYGTLSLGPAEAATSFLVVTEEPSNGPARCWVDANANGDLTDDPVVEWTPKAYKSRDGTALAMHSGSAKLLARQGGLDLAVRVQLYRFDARDSDRAALRDTLLYYGDYVRRGTLELAGRSLPALLCDDRTTGDFRGAAGKDSGSGVRLALDLDGDGVFDRRPWESFDVRGPFKVLGQTWEIRDLAWNGQTFRLESSSAVVEEVAPPPSTAVGQPFPAFTAKTLTGAPVEFPSGYKGRLVLLDFWATWCGPCVGELPNLRAAYAEFKDRGVEVLGISLDDDDARDKVQAFLTKHEITWSQIYEGGGWGTRLARQYGIDSIPRVFLVDGDSAKILAQTRELRGPALAETLRKALADRAAAVKNP